MKTLHNAQPEDARTFTRGNVGFVLEDTLLLNFDIRYDLICIDTLAGDEELNIDL